MSTCPSNYLMEELKGEDRHAYSLLLDRKSFGGKGGHDYEDYNAEIKKRMLERDLTEEEAAAEMEERKGEDRHAYSLFNDNESSSTKKELGVPREAAVQQLLPIYLRLAQWIRWLLTSCTLCSSLPPKNSTHFSTWMTSRRQYSLQQDLRTGVNRVYPLTNSRPSMFTIMMYTVSLCRTYRQCRSTQRNPHQGLQRKPKFLGEQTARTSLPPRSSRRTCSLLSCITSAEVECTSCMQDRTHAVQGQDVNNLGCCCEICRG